MTHADDSILLLQQNLDLLDKSLRHLRRSYQAGQGIGVKDTYSDEEYDAFETLTSRYARISDMMIHKIFRSIDRVEMVDGGTMLDAVHRADKRRLIESVERIRLIKDLRNQIVHEYQITDLQELFSDVLRETAELFAMVERIKTYCQKYAAIPNEEKDPK